MSESLPLGRHDNTVNNESSGIQGNKAGGFKGDSDILGALLLTAMEISHLDVKCLV